MNVRASVFAELQRHIDRYRARGGKLIPLQIGDTHWSPPAAAQIAELATLAAGDTNTYRYGPLAGLPELLERISSSLASRLPGLDPQDNIQIGCGATHALFCAARAVLDPGDDVLVAAPYWPLVPGIVHACGARPVEVPLTTALFAEPGLDAGAPFRAAMTSRTKAIYLITPNNPDGKVLCAVDLEAIADLARQHDLWVFADEVYADFVFDGPHVSIAALPEMFERTITAYSFSKSHALAGMRVGYIVASKAVVEAARRVSNHTIYNTPTFTQRVALAALDSPASWQRDVAAECRSARDAAVSALRGSGATFSVPQGGAYIFLDFSDALGDRPLRVLLERAIDHGVLVAPGEAFGDSFARFGRVCYTGVDRPALVDGIARLRAAIDSL
jgi:aspartate/methionine/tyrosine aminotransferase